MGLSTPGAFAGLPATTDDLGGLATMFVFQPHDPDHDRLRGHCAGSSRRSGVGFGAILSRHHGRPPCNPGIRRPASVTSDRSSLVNPRYSEMPRVRVLLLSAATLTFLNISVVAHAQYYPPPPPGYGYSPPPCQAVTPGPFQGAARGAAGGALIGAISGNAGRGAAIGAGFGALRSAVRRGSARSAGACY